MKIKYILFIGLGMFLTHTLGAQVNLIKNSNLEASTGCGTFATPSGCNSIQDCVDFWHTTHGTPTYETHICDPDGNNQPPDHHIEMRCRPTTSEGIFTNVNLSTGTYRLYLRFAFLASFASQSSAPDANLRISLNRNINLAPQTLCEETIPTASESKMILNQVFPSPSPVWQWLSVDFTITSSQQDLDQLMITGLSTGNSFVVIGVDCIHLYESCVDEMDITLPPNTQANFGNGSFESCTFINAETPESSSLTVVSGSDVTFQASDYIRIAKNFRASSNFRAHIKKVNLDGFEPYCCFILPIIGDDPPGGDGGDKEKRIGKNGPFDFELFPNPTVGSFNLKLPAGDYELIIYDELGKVVFQGQLDTGQPINVEEWRKGLYLVEVIDQATRERSVKKLLIQ